jgi:hypothetical protein
MTDDGHEAVKILSSWSYVYQALETHSDNRLLPELKLMATGHCRAHETLLRHVKVDIPRLKR